MSSLFFTALQVSLESLLLLRRTKIDGTQMFGFCKQACRRPRESCRSSSHHRNLSRLELCGLQNVASIPQNVLRAGTQLTEEMFLPGSRFSP